MAERGGIGSEPSPIPNNEHEDYFVLEGDDDDRS